MSMNGQKSNYTDAELLEHARQYKTHSEWKASVSEDRKASRPIRYYAAKKRGVEFVAQCTSHMVRAEKSHPSVRSDTELAESAKRFETVAEWKQGDYPAYQAARYQARVKGRSDFVKEITRHMVTRGNPYNGAYFIYAITFPATSHCYVGLSCRAEDVRRSEHGRTGPVFRYSQSLIALTGNSGMLWEVLERNIADPEAVRAAEVRWFEAKKASGLTMLNSASPGSLGTVSFRVTKDEIHQRALDFRTRGEFAKMDRSAHRIATDRGWMDEITTHMEDTAEVRSRAHAGRKFSEATIQKMRDAKMGLKHSSEHNAKISSSVAVTWQDASIREKRMAAHALSNKGRPKGWLLNADEAAHLGLAGAGLHVITEDQKKATLRFRYHKKKQPAPGRTIAIEVAP